MKVVEQFKRRILDLAIRGKLVPQDPNDEPASELLARIKAEKEKLIKAGKIRKGKSSAVGSDGAAYEKLSDDVPFELPKGWARIRIGDVFHLHAGKYISAKDIHNQCEEYSIPCFGGNGLRGYVAKANTHDIHAIIGRQGALCGCLNISDSDFYATEHAVVVDCYCGMTGEFAFHFLGALNLNRYATATAQPGLSVAVVNEVPFPLPPFNEQKKIVTCIEELFKAADSLGETADGLDAAAKRLDKKILDLAIRGKLVPQNPDDEPASELLKLIAATSHKSPCKNHETPIEPPFAIPESWEWAKLGEIISLLSGRDLSPSDYSSFVNQFPYITGASNFVDGRLVVNRWTDKAITISHNGDLLITCKGTIGAMAINNIGDIHIARQIMAISSSGMDLKFIKIFLESAISTLKDSATSMIPGIGRNTVLNLLIPVPPLSEQKRIVTRVQGARDILALLFP